DPVASVTRALTVFFFFQAADGIRDFHVTGVQTCALPIFGRAELPARVTMRREQLVGYVSEVRKRLDDLRRDRIYVEGGFDAAGAVGRASCRGRGGITEARRSAEKRKNSEQSARLMPHARR